MSNLLHFSSHTLQEIALVFMATVYFLRIRWFLKWPLAKERQPALLKALQETRVKEMGLELEVRMRIPGELLRDQQGAGPS